MEMIDKNDLQELAIEKGVDTQALADFETQYGVEEIQKIVASCDTMEEACQKLCEKFPSLKYEDLKKQFDEYVAKAQENDGDSESEEIVDLDEDDLEAVAGGGIGSWLKKNWAGLVVGAAVTVACTAIGAPMLGMVMAPTLTSMVNQQVQKKDTPADAKADNSHNF